MIEIWLWTPRSTCARLMPVQTQSLPVCMVMRNIQILPAPRVGLNSSHFWRLSCLVAVKATNRDGSVDSGSHNNSSFCLLQRAVSYNGHGEVCQTSYWKDYHECLHVRSQFGSISAGKNSASTVHTPKQRLHNQDDLVSQRDLQERISITQDQHHQTIRWYLYKRSHTFFKYLQLGDIFTKGLIFWIFLEEDNGMVNPLTPHNSNVLVQVSRGSVVPGHGDLCI